MKAITSFGETSKKNTSSKVNSTVFDDQRTCPVFGIDLGTTNSAISVIRNGKSPESIKLHSGKYTMPSCVMWHDGEFIVGDEAYMKRDQENVIYSVKRLMQDTTATVTLKDRNDKITLTPAEVSAKILRGIVDQTDGFYGDIKDVVVTVPAYFDQNGINATRKACELAGLNLIAIANEPTAASLCYDLSPDDGGTKDVVIYDLGGGTFDVTLARIVSNEDSADLDDIYGISDESGDSKSGRVVTTLAIDGDSHLGGDDVDHEMLKILFKHLKKQGIDGESFKDSYKEQLILRLEHLKKLGVKQMYDVEINTLSKDGKEVKASVRINGDDFRDALVPIYEKTKTILLRLLNEAQNTADTIVLVGGSTKNQWLVEMLREDFPDFRIDNAFNPDLSVSNGAAIQGKVTKFGDSDVQIFDILPLTIGILDDSTVNPFIEKGTSLPYIRTASFTTVVDNQTDLTVELLQGNSSFKEECVSLGTLNLTGIAPKPAGEPTLLVTIKVSADRLMTCTATIDGQVKEIKLNLAGETSISKKLTQADKKVLRWETFAKTLVGSDVENFKSLLQDYKDCLAKGVSATNAEKTVKDFIKKHREKITGAE